MRGCSTPGCDCLAPPLPTPLPILSDSTGALAINLPVPHVCLCRVCVYTCDHIRPLSPSPSCELIFSLFFLISFCLLLDFHLLKAWWETQHSTLLINVKKTLHKSSLLKRSHLSLILWVYSGPSCRSFFPVLNTLSPTSTSSTLPPNGPPSHRDKAGLATSTGEGPAPKRPFYTRAPAGFAFSSSLILLALGEVQFSDKAEETYRVLRLARENSWDGWCVVMWFGCEW